MTNMVVAELGRIPMSANLAATLSRATDYARAQQHLEVTLEHLLLALIEDPEAGLVLTASNIDASRLSADVSGHLGRIEERAPPDRQGQLVVSSDLRRILEAAAAAAQQGRRREINGAIVLAAVVGDGRSTAAHLLSAHGLTFEGAIHALQRANAQAASPTASPIANQPGAVPQSQPPQPPSQPQPPARVADTATAPQNLPAPQPPSMDDLLAEARERVRKRHAPGGSAEVQHAPAELAAPEPEPTASPEASVAETYVPDWREPAAPAVPPEPRIEPTFPPMVAQPAPLPLPGPPAAGEMPSFGASSPHPPQVPQRPDQQRLDQQRPDQQRPASPPPGSPLPPRPGVHPHRPMPPDRGARQPPAPALPPPSMPAGAANGSWAPSPPHMPSGPPTGPRPMRQPPPLPPGVPPPAARGRQMPTSDEMAHELRRVQPAQLQPHMHGPVAGPMPGPLSAPATAGPLQSAPTGRPRAGGASASVEIGQLVENIPKVMRVAVPQRVEVRIGKANVKALAEGLQGGGAAFRHEVMVTKAMCVRLRAPEGGFYIESASPETQWIESTLGLMSDDHASWRWTVTPRARGWKRLQLVVSARTVGSDGLAAETALPDQVIDVKVRTNYGKAAATASAWVAAAIAGGLLAKFGEGAFVAVWQVAMKGMGG